MKTAQHVLDWIFWEVWEALAACGHCDSGGGAEYHRVLQEWHDAGYPDVGIGQFILDRANLFCVTTLERLVKKNADESS